MPRTHFVLLMSILVAICLPMMSAADTAQDECMIIGEGGDPAQARQLYDAAIAALTRGDTGTALEKYEDALLTDRSVLSLDDHGMGRRLLDHYRAQAETASPSIALLCRVGFLENTLAGNLRSAITFYEQAAKTGTSPTARQVAQHEAERLRRELAYVVRWQAQRTRVTARERAVDEARTQIADLAAERQRQRDELVDERDELLERLNYLKREEATLAESLQASIDRAEKYHRLYYRGSEESRGKRLYLARQNYARSDAASQQTALAQLKAESMALQARVDALSQRIVEFDRQTATATGRSSPQVPKE